MLETGHIIIHQLGDGRVLANDDETRRQLNAAFLPEVIRLFVVSVKGLQRRLEPGGQFQGIEACRLAPAFLGHVLADMLPEVPEHGHLPAGDVVRHRHARQFDDAAFDGVHQGEVVHRPGKEGQKE